MKHYRILLISFVTTAIALSFFSCKKSEPSAPVIPEEIKPGSRDYIWTADTTGPMPFNFVRRMWGDAEDNVWAVGCTGDPDKIIWRFDGKKWSLQPPMPMIDPTCIFGFGRQIWIGGIWGKFWRYNGYTDRYMWDMDSEFKRDDGRDIGFENIWGDSPNNLYAVGEALPQSGSKCLAVLMHYSGTSWSDIKIPEVMGGFQDIKKDKESQLYFISHFKAYDTEPDSNKIFTYDGKNLKEIYAGLDNRKEHCGISLVDGNVWITIGKKIYTYRNNQLVLKQDLSSTDFLGFIVGRSDKDFFYQTEKNGLNGCGIGHYNGTDFITVYPNFTFYCYVLLEKSVFFYSYDFSSGKNIFLRGKFNE